MGSDPLEDPQKTDLAADGPSESGPRAPSDDIVSLPTDDHGRLFGKYRVIRKLGDGGMGSVWRGEQLARGRPRALRVSVSGGGDSESNRLRFHREAVILARLSRHPNAVLVHDTGFTGRFGYVEMEYVEGPTLRQRLERTGP